MNMPLRKDECAVLLAPKRSADQVITPRPAEGDHLKQVACARNLVMDRYRPAFEQLAKV